MLVALRLYSTEPFGRLHKSNPTIVRAAEAIGRTPSALAMKACNFASLDATFRRTNRKGLGNASRADRELWREYQAGGDDVVDEAEGLADALSIDGPGIIYDELPPLGPSEVVRPVRVRRLQRFFSRSVRSAYEGACAVTGMKVPALNVASHIIPWRDNLERRADPTNGLLLNGLLDRAFDSLLITFDEDQRLVCAAILQKNTSGAQILVDLEGRPLLVPRRSRPDPAALSHHRARFFALQASQEFAVP